MSVPDHRKRRPRRRTREVDPGLLCPGCGLFLDFCCCDDDGWDDVEEDRESGYPETQGGFYEES